jgi:glucokinase
MKHIFAADIGGTHSRFGHFVLHGDNSLSLEETLWLMTAESESFPVLLENLRLSGFPLLPEAADIAVFAVAGPVEDGVRSRPPLIAWDIDLRRFHETRAGGFLLINDFVAQAFACRSPVAEGAEIVLTGSPVSGAATGVIGAGTGLGKALLVQDGRGGYLALPSEGGHTNFPFSSEQEFRYQQFLMQERGDQYITWNAVVSGKGLSYLHRFLTGRVKEPSEVAEEIELFPDTLEWASRFYARACRNYVLETLALGGLFVVGGVATRSPELLRQPAFEQEFRNSDTMAHLMNRVPVSLIRDQNSGLWGAAVLARQKLLEKQA